MRSDVVALYVDRLGPYPKLVEQWYDEARDARTYAGPWPVVAHPPCGPHSSPKHLSRKPEDGCGFRAIEQVREFGGVVEQPKGSSLFAKAGIPWNLLVRVDQVAWQHVARKATWLYFVGVPLERVLGTIRHGGTPTHWVSGGRKHRDDRPDSSLIPEGIKVCSAQQRRRTPVAFAEWLLDLAAQARPSAAHLRQIAGAT